MTSRATRRLLLRACASCRALHALAWLSSLGAPAILVGCRGASERAERATEQAAASTQPETQPDKSAPEPEETAQAQQAHADPPVLPSAVAAAAATIVRVESYDAASPKAASEPDYPYAGYRKHRSGMGVITEAEGYILTTYSLLSKPDSSELVSLVDVSALVDGAPHRRAIVMGVEPTLDLAIIRVEPTRGSRGVGGKPRRKIEPGERLFAITGAHDGLSFAAGTLEELASKECYQESISATMLNVDIDLPKDSLGCPIFSAKGELIGLHTQHADAREPLARGDHEDRHILPIELAFNIYEPLKRKRTIASPWTGFSVRRLEPKEQARFPVKRYLGGVVIEYVWKEGPAYKLGLRTGDILMRFSYYPTLSVADFQKWLYEYGVGAEVTLHVLRGEEILKLPYVIEARPSWAVPR